ncbi:hypothetical protein ACVWWK_002257 [Bradyrhizobium sp. LB9.1b]
MGFSRKIYDLTGQGRALASVENKLRSGGPGAFRSQDIGANFEALSLPVRRNETGADLIGDGDVEPVFENDGASWVSPASSGSFDNFARLEVVIEAELAGMVHEDEQRFLSPPNDGSAVWLQEEFAHLLAGLVGYREKAAIAA